MSSSIHRCRVGQCKVLASTIIGHTSKQVHMCATHAEDFRGGHPAAQRAMLLTARPPDTFNSGTKFASAFTYNAE